MKDKIIADSKGMVGWIKCQDVNTELEDTFSPFFMQVDTVITGTLIVRYLKNLSLTVGHMMGLQSSSWIIRIVSIKKKYSIK